jgi:drug/metabolite transporter (DMT)-like permease
MTQWKYSVFPLGAILIWAGNTVVSKLSAGLIAPEAISFYRWLLAGLLMTPFLIRPVWQARHIYRPYWKHIAALTLLGMVLYQSLAYFAAATSTATSMGVIASLLPLLTVLLSTIFMKEPPTIGMIGGGLLSLYGIVILISNGQPGILLDHGVVFGDLLMLIATIAYSLYGVLLRKWALPIPPWHLLYLQVILAIVMLFPGFYFGQHSPVTMANLPLVLYAGIAASIGSQILWMRSVAYFGASRSGMFMNLFPIFTVIIAVVALGESVHWYHIVGGGITLIGVLLAQLLKKQIVFKRRSH